MENENNKIPDRIGSAPAPAENPATETAQQEEIKRFQTESEFIHYLESKNTDYILLVGPRQCGKTSIISSLIHYLSETDKSLGEMEIIRNAEDRKYEKTNTNLDEKIKEKMNRRIFPGRTEIGSLNHLNIDFKPNSGKPRVSLTFLDVAGEYFKDFKAGKLGSEDFQRDVDVYFKANPEKVRMKFVLVTAYSEAADTDALFVNFLDYIVSKERKYKNAEILLLVSKWDEYQGGKSVREFVKDTMQATWKKIGSQSKVDSFSLGKVDKIVEEDEGVTEERGFIVKYDDEPARKVFRWLYLSVTGKHLLSWWRRFFGGD